MSPRGPLEDHAPPPNMGMTGLKDRPQNGQRGSLDHIGLIEYFDLDSDLILVYRLGSRSQEFENKALVTWKRASPKDASALTEPAFLNWACAGNTSETIGEFAIAGKVWRTTLLRKSWVVVRGQSQPAVPSASQAIPPTPPIDPVTQASLAREAATAQPKDHSFSPALSQTSSTSLVDLNLGKTLDWTRYHVPGLSAHIRSIKSFPWHETPIGGIETWPDILRSMVIYLNANSEPRVLLWGSERIMIYNEACGPLFGIKHPCLGARGEDTWAEAWSALGIFVSRAENEGIATHIAKMPVPMGRFGYNEETFWTANFVPIIGAKGKALGVVDEFSEITNLVITERRREIVARTTEALLNVSTLDELWSEFLQSVNNAEDDVPYAAVYVPADSTQENPVGARTPDGLAPIFSLFKSVGLQADDPFETFKHLDMDDRDPEKHLFLTACQAAIKTGDAVYMRGSEGTLPSRMAIGIPGRAAGERVNTVCVIPITDLIGNNPLAFVVIALTPRRPVDGSATTLIQYLRDILVRSSSTIFLPDEQRRARMRFQEIETALHLQLRDTSLKAERNEARYERMFSDSPLGMYVLSPDQKLLYYNDAYLACTGCTKEFVESAEDQLGLIDPRDVDRIYSLWLTCLQEKRRISSQYRVVKEWRSIDAATGKEIVDETWLLTSAEPELDEHGNVVQVMGWMLDISEQKYHEKKNIERLHEEELEVRFGRLAEASAVGMYLLKPDGSPIYLNAAYFDILGLSRKEFDLAAEINDVGWADTILEEDMPLVTEAWTKLSLYGEPLSIEYRIKKPWKAIDQATGTEMSGPTWLQGTAFAEKDDQGNVKTVQGFVSEISLKKFSERLLAERLEEALETKRQADRFIDMTSHEIRNPLSAILQSADGILTSIGADQNETVSSGDLSVTDSTATIIDAAQTIILCAQHQKRIVDDILTLSKLDSSLLVIAPDHVALPSLLQKCMKMYEAEAQRADIDARLVIEDAYRNLLGSDGVMIDGSRVLQVVINLLTNAIKFSQYAEIRKVTVYLNASKERPNHSNHKASFIDRRGDRPDLTSGPDWGKGEELYLQICVKDSGRGLTEEELKVLFNRFSQASPKTYKQYGGSGLGLFISRELTELQGGQIGVYSAGAGQGSTFSFYIKARRATSNHRISADGLSLALTPRPGSSSAVGAVELGLLPAIPLANSSPRIGSESKAVEIVPSSLHVLVVEDNEINQRVMATQLRRLGCTVSLAQHGLEALGFLESTTAWVTRPGDDTSTARGEKISLSVILMDLEMPVLGGLDCVQRIRDLQRQGRLKTHIPVIAVTANARSEQIAHAIGCGMDAVVTKPFRIPELVPQMVELVTRLGNA